MAAIIGIILFALLFLVGIGLWVNASLKVSKLERKVNETSDRYDRQEIEEKVFGAKAFRWVARGLTLVGFVGGLIVLLTSTIVINGQGEAKVITNIDGSVAQVVDTTTTVTKAPWQEYVDFDLFSQELVYAGGDVAPSYTGGQVNGKEVTVSVGGLNGGSTQANVDISITYSLSGEKIEDIYKQFRNQERFTRQVVEKTVLAVTRTAPADLTAIEFRGAKKDEVAVTIQQRVNDKLKDYGLTIDFVNIQAPRFPENVEQALNDVEAANQAAAKAEAEQRQALVQAETKRIEAQGVADANAILTQSLTPQVLQQRYIDALAKSGTIYVVPEGSTPLVTVK